MLKKSFLVAAMLFAFGAASFAADNVSLDLNFWCRGHLKLLNELPDGITMTDRLNYKQPQFAHICLYTVKIDVSKVQEFNLELEVVDTGDKETAELKPSLCPTGGMTVECQAFETDGEPSSKAPGMIKGWTSMQVVKVTKGEKITVKGKLKKVEK
jgi:hypothetical protein